MIDTLIALIAPLFGAIAGGVGVYVGIRSDIAHLRARVEHTERSADQAHSRIDSILQSRTRD